MESYETQVEVPKKHATLILMNVCVGQFIVGLDQRALLVALPTLSHIFNTSLTTIQWVLLIYDLLLIGTVITVGRLGDLFGRRRLYAGGFIMFVLSSALCGAAQSASQIILFRGLQAVGGAMISANGRAVASVALPANQRGKAMGIASMAFHIGFLTGPTLGGFLIDTVGWRWIFYLNLPIGIWGAYLAWKLLEESKEDVEGISVDFPGAILLMMTCSLFIYAMNQLPHVGWRDPTVLKMMSLFLVSLVLFVFVELRARTPILSFSLFRNRLFTASILSLFFITSAIGHQFSHALLSAKHPAFLAGANGLDLDCRLSRHRHGRTHCRLDVRPFGLPPSLHRRLCFDCYRAIFHRFVGPGCFDPAHYFSSDAFRPGLGDLQFTEPERNLGLCAKG
jgi:EmrB/QacA subfamily drug resistance transporter